MEDSAAAMPEKSAQAKHDAVSVTSQPVPTQGSLRLSGMAPTVVGHSGNAAYLLGWVALRRGLAGLGRWLGVRRKARLVMEQTHCTYREDLNLLGLDVRSSEEVIPWRQVESVEVTRVSGTWPVVLGAVILLVGATWGLIRMAEGFFGKDSGILARGVAILVFSLAADMILALVAAKVLPKRWQVILKLTSGNARAIETASEKDVEPARTSLTKRLLNQGR